MERSVAIKRLGKLLGKSLGYRIDDKAPTQEAREAAKAELLAAIEDRNKLKEKRDERYMMILAADAEYQAFKVAHEAARERVNRLFSITRHHKITVGVTNSMFFHVKAEGDSWEEIIAKLQTEKLTT
jgi:hypothetical protein